jgi:hypothetical protein
LAFPGPVDPKSSRDEIGGIEGLADRPDGFESADASGSLSVCPETSSERASEAIQEPVKSVGIICDCLLLADSQ